MNRDSAGMNGASGYHICNVHQGTPTLQVSHQSLRPLTCQTHVLAKQLFAWPTLSSASLLTETII